jgi:uncharacterized protein (TIGR00730 family)
MNRICVFCGSNSGSRPIYSDAARELGQVLARRKIALVYGGGSIGLMGILADATLAAGGDVIGVIPQGLFRREVAHNGLTELRFVTSMHQRKAMMADLSDGFIALPGGYGTFEELSEIVTWAQLGIHAKPCGVLNIENYYTPFLAFLDHAVREEFLRPAHRAIIQEDSNVEDLLNKMLEYTPPKVEKWMDLDET